MTQTQTQKSETKKTPVPTPTKTQAPKQVSAEKPARQSKSFLHAVVAVDHTYAPDPAAQGSQAIRFI